MISNQQVARALFLLNPAVKQLIYATRFLPTDSKDGLFRDWEHFYGAVNDILQRESGLTPATSTQRAAAQKIWKKMQ